MDPSPPRQQGQPPLLAQRARIVFPQGIQLLRNGFWEILLLLFITPSQKRGYN
jgi:hypothetical protein